MSLEFSQELDTPIISPTYAPQDAGEIGLRPKLLSDYTGQEKAKGNLSIYIEAARRRNEPLDHTLLYGPPGLGMTLIRNAAITHEGVLLVVPQETGGTLVSICITMQSPKNDRVQSPIIRCDYAGEQDHGLLELSDLLPNELYE